VRYGSKELFSLDSPNQRETAMGKSGNFVLGTLIGVAAGAVIGYILGPAQNSRFDHNYTSRLDRALDEGRKAEALRAEEMRREFLQAKRRPAAGE